MKEKIDINTLAMATMLKAWRIRHSITIYRIAKEMNIDPHTLARIEKGENIRSDALMRYFEFVRMVDNEFDIIGEWENMKKYFSIGH